MTPEACRGPEDSDEFITEDADRRLPGCYDVALDEGASGCIWDVRRRDAAQP
jgi:hypothetical protein